MEIFINLVLGSVAICFLAMLMKITIDMITHG